MRDPQPEYTLPSDYDPDEIVVQLEFVGIDNKPVVVKVPSDPFLISRDYSALVPNLKDYEGLLFTIPDELKNQGYFIFGTVRLPVQDTSRM